jgi:hypothetical protein
LEAQARRRQSGSKRMEVKIWDCFEVAGCSWGGRECTDGREGQAGSERRSQEVDFWDSSGR